ncbi:MAG: hypothetical protein KJZ58_13090 [Flavobacteriales bacterium]|nr:hypothetical protein [Flavobacteriales bacterium]MCL4283183.1 hypothetical protein [Flavobacteriales bacterium]
MYLLSANGTLRTILILLIIWQLLRLWMRMRQANRPGAGERWSDEPPRPKGDIRIERVDGLHGPSRPTQAEDADFEVIKDEPKN